MTIEQNKKIAEKWHSEASIPEKCKFEVLNKCVEFSFAGSSFVYAIDYQQGGFQEKLKEAFKKYGIKPK